MEHVALYRLFRPMNFDEIVEQAHAVAALRQSVISGKIGHAYLFCGTRGTGKTSIAKVFSRAINCLHPENGNPCNKCEICKGVIDGSLLDVIEMDAASNNSVDNIRRICDEVMFMPAKAKYKVYIIDEVHMLSTGAFNALLKTLEEPPAHAVFLLATTEPHRIPATILSRCQRYDFRRISNESIVARLQHIADTQHISIEKDALSAIATIGDGALRDSVSLLDQVSTTAVGKTITRDDILRITGVVDEGFLRRFATAMLDGKPVEVLNLCRELFMDGRDLTRFTLDLAQYFRNIMVTQISSSPAALIDSTSAAIADMTELGKRIPTKYVLAVIAKLSELVSELKWSPSARTSFEIMILNLTNGLSKYAKPGTAPEPRPEVKPEPKPAPAVVPVATPVVPETPAIAKAAATPVAPPPIAVPVSEPSKVPAIAEPTAQEPETLRGSETKAAPEPVSVPLSLPEEPKAEKVMAPPPLPMEQMITPPSAEGTLPPPPIAELLPKKEEISLPVPPIASAAPKKEEASIPVPPIASNIPSVPPVPPIAEEPLTPPTPTEDDFLPPPPVPDDSFAPPPPEEAPEESQQPTAAELAQTAPTSPNLHKAFSSNHVSQGQATNLAKAVREPEVRAPHMPRDIVMPEGMEPSKDPAETAPHSNLQSVTRSEGASAFEAARKEFMDYLKSEHYFESLFMQECRLTWKDQTVFCIMPDTYADNINFIRENGIILTNLLRICQKQEPALLHTTILSEKDYQAGGADPAVPVAEPATPEWAKALKATAEKNNIPITNIDNM